MSLKIWLPLLGNIENKGTHNATVTLSGATVDTAGKIGSCYSFDGTDDYIQLTNFTPNGWSEFSLSAWIYPTADFNGFFLIRGGSMHRITINNSGFVFRDTNNSTQRYTQFSPTISTNIWTHIACVYKRGEIWLYQNGILSAHNSTYYNASSTLLSDMNEIRIARVQSSSGNVYFTGKINDFRIYDHALSAVEVHELAQGLVMHYKLDDADNVHNENYLAITPANNVWTYPTFDTSSAAGGWSHWGPSGSSHTHGQNTDKTYIYNKSQTYSHYFSENEGTGKYYMCYKTGAFAGGFRSIHCILKGQNNENPQGKIVATCNSFVSGGAPLETWTSIKYLGDGFYYCKWEGFKQSEATSTASLVGFSVFSGYKFYISEAYIENSEICTSLFGDNTTTYDSSGYGRHGTYKNTHGIFYDSIRHSACVHLPAGNSVIDCGRGAMVKDSLTVNMWIKASAWANPISCTETGGWNFEKNSSVIQFPVYVSSVGYKTITSTTTTTAVCNNTWRMLTGVYDRVNQKIKIYIDGVKEKEADTGTSNNIGYHSSNHIWIGGEATSGSFSNGMIGYFSDVRIYATPLSDDDIKELYRVGLKIDNRSGMHTYELHEAQDQLYPADQGILQCEHLEEDEKASFFKDKHIETNNLTEM